MIDVERLAAIRGRHLGCEEPPPVGDGCDIGFLLALLDRPLRFQGDPLYGNAKLLTEGWKSTEQETGVYLLECDA